MNAELKACSFLERLIERLYDATVNYHCSGGVHEFVVRYAGSRFKIEFSEPDLLRKSERDLDQAAGRIVERIRTLSKAGPTPAASASAARAGAEALRPSQRQLDDHSRGLIREYQRTASPRQIDA